MVNVEAAVDRAFNLGMFQHRAEILPFAKFVASREPKRILEIGALHGGTSILFCELASETVVSVDLPDGTFGGAAHHLNVGKCEARNERIQALYPHFHGVLGDSHSFETVGKVVEIAEEYDLLFIDGDHTLEGVSSDYAMYSPLVRAGGFVAFHDINETEFHHRAGCFVDQFWRSLRGVKQAFTIEADWGGIGVVSV